MADETSWITKALFAVGGVAASVLTGLTAWLINRRKTSAETTSIMEATNRTSAQFDIEFSREVRKELHEATRQLTEAYRKLTQSEKVLRKMLRKFRDCWPEDEEEYKALEREIDQIHG